MKVIVTGATGFIGKQVVVQCIQNPTITSVIVLTRREIDKNLSSDPKVQVIIHQDFETYPQELLHQLQGSQGCIWCLGGKVGDFPDLETARKVGVDYTLAAANAFVKGVCPGFQSQSQKFQFVFCSGDGAEWDQDKSLWMFSDTRKIKGSVERGLLDIAEANPNVFAATMLRPGGVIPDDKEVLGTIGGLMMIPVVKVSQLAKALVRVCVEPPDARVVPNKEIRRLGA
ncbi:hypothetical protein H2204_002455 [Knufia peltigerae]|uniref:NAD-dependent epimerase/dehydratase domain-containing protein n=1 Tax=Knufia peltigerae TaxID=1002370 RepID=A0AA38YAS3_9EURO|nr:hypothetical protein H2204_002455 [Knufia peltigerae]